MNKKWIWLAVGIALGILLAIAINSYAFYDVEPDLKAVWNRRTDVRKLFPDGWNGVKRMRGWTLEEWATEFGSMEEPDSLIYYSAFWRERIFKKYLPLERALQKIAKREYVKSGKNKYNCVDFSRDLQKLLEEQNIASVQLEGQIPQGRHRWIAVQFEPITGRIVTIKENYQVDKTINYNN